MTILNSAGALVTIAVGFLGLLAMLWKISAAIVRHIDATKANTTALGSLGQTLSDHIVRSEERYLNHNARIRALERQRNAT